MTEQLLSPIAEAIIKRGPRGNSVEVSGFLGLGGSPIPRIYLQIVPKQEEDLAVVCAHAYAADIGSKAGAGADAARSDTDILYDSKLIEVLWRACRKDDEREYNAFPSPGWMRANLSTQEIGALVHLHNEVKRSLGVAPNLTDEGVEALISLAIAASREGADGLPQRILAQCNREALSEAFVCVAIKLDVVRKESAEHLAELMLLRERLAEMEASKALPDDLGPSDGDMPDDTQVGSSDQPLGDMASSVGGS